MVLLFCFFVWIVYKYSLSWRQRLVLFSYFGCFPFLFEIDSHWRSPSWPRNYVDQDCLKFEVIFCLCFLKAGVCCTLWLSSSFYIWYTVVTYCLVTSVFPVELLWFLCCYLVDHKYDSLLNTVQISMSILNGGTISSWLLYLNELSTQTGAYPSTVILLHGAYCQTLLLT